MIMLRFRVVLGAHAFTFKERDITPLLGLTFMAGVVLLVAMTTFA